MVSYSVSILNKNAATNFYSVEKDMELLFFNICFYLESELLLAGVIDGSQITRKVAFSPGENVVDLLSLFPGYKRKEFLTIKEQSSFSLFLNRELTAGERLDVFLSFNYLPTPISTEGSSPLSLSYLWVKEIPGTYNVSWLDLADFKFCRFFCIGGGGGGAGGAIAAPDALSRGGGGGGGACVFDSGIFPLVEIPQSNLIVTVGNGGNGGSFALSNSSTGTGGADGGMSSIEVGGVLCAAATGGKGGNPSSAGGAQSFPSSSNSVKGTACGSGGGTSSSTGGAGVAGGLVTSAVPSGGGGGGGISSANTPSSGGNAFQHEQLSDLLILAGEAGKRSVPGWPGSGGGGGAAGLESGISGGDGTRGGGGGGGGASRNGAFSGLGGKGGHGYVLIMAF